VLGAGKSRHRLRDAQVSTCNDLKLTELLVRAAQVQPLISVFLRSGQMHYALTEAAKLEDVVRKINWRILELIDERGKK